MLGHKSVVTTQKYLGVNYASVRDALQKMSLDAELHEIGILGSSLKKEADATLFLELALRGYDLSKLRGLYPPTKRPTPPKSSKSAKSLFVPQTFSLCASTLPTAPSLYPAAPICPFKRMPRVSV